MYLLTPNFERRNEMEIKQTSLWLKVKVLVLVGSFTVCSCIVLFQFDDSRAMARGRCGSCSKTSLAAYKAGKFEAMEDYWIANGNCNNLLDRDERNECMRDAWEERLSAKEECRDQFEARQEICEELGQEPYDPQPDPADFVDPDDIDSETANPYLPLIPGTVWIYEGETEDGTETITVTVTDDTKEIEYPAESGQIFICRVVRDVVELEGEAIEDTDDWFAQDMEGNVWYFGEISLEFEDGELVGLEGSWKAGEDGAKPGIVMGADPEVGDFYRQEFLLGEAEDMGEVVSRGDESVTVPAGTYDDDVLKTRDWTPIEPDAVEFKYYAPGVGMVLEVNPESGERVELINNTTP
jgi:hypothetical protein